MGTAQPVGIIMISLNGKCAPPVKDRRQKGGISRAGTKIHGMPVCNLT